jgi:hypothetical protein
LIGVGIDVYAEIFAAVVYNSKLLGGNYKGQDLEIPIEVKFANFTYSKGGSYSASIGGLKNKTCDLFVVLSDEEFNAVKKQNEELTNKILDKISKSGYESLTKSEKDFLFKQSKNG